MSAGFANEELALLSGTASQGTFSRVLVLSYHVLAGLCCLFRVPVPKLPLRGNFGCCHEKYPVKLVYLKRFTGARCPGALGRRSLWRQPDAALLFQSKHTLVCL